VASADDAKLVEELVAHLEPHRPRLSESEMVGVGGASPANQTRLRCNEFKVGFVAESSRLAERELMPRSICQWRKRQSPSGLAAESMVTIEKAGTHEFE
jgi:hypothetical protein